MSGIYSQEMGRQIRGAHVKQNVPNYEHTPLNITERQVRLLELCKDTGYELAQINGQRRYGPPPNWKGPRPAKGSELFIGGIPRDAFEYELVPLFRNYGTIYEMRLMMEFSGENKGFGFVTMSNPWEASLACSGLNQYEMRPGRRIGVVPSLDNRRLFLGGLPKHMQKDEILQTLKQLVEGVQDVIMYPSVENKNLGRGYVFLEFDSHRSGAIAKRLLPSELKLRFGSQVVLEWADMEPYVDEVVMSKVTVVFMRNLFLHTNESVIKQHIINGAGGRDCVLKVKKIKDFAFIHFVTREDAQRALEFWNGKNMDGAIVETSWAKPVDKIMRYPKKRAPEVILPSLDKSQLLESLSCSKVKLTDGKQSSSTAHTDAPFVPLTKTDEPSCYYEERSFKSTPTTGQTMQSPIPSFNIESECSSRECTEWTTYAMESCDTVNTVNVYADIQDEVIASSLVLF